MLLRNIIFISIFYQISATREQNDRYLLLVISLDGFRHDYLDKYSNQNGFLSKFAQSGFRAAWSESIFPSNTYPNHWSIVTGLYAESHGIINNDIYDPMTKQHYRMAKDAEDSPDWFQDAEPVWIKNEKENSAKHSAVFDWPGAPAIFNKLQPKVFRQIKYENWFINTFNDTIDKFVEAIEPGKTNLAFLYLGEPDMAGHYYGPESKQVENTVKEIDHVLDYLFNSLKTRRNYDIENEIDVLIVTDHGMSTIREPNEDTKKRHLFLTDYIDVGKYLLVEKCTYGSLAELWFKEGEEDSLDSVYNMLKAKILEHDGHKIKEIYLKKDIPQRFNLNGHRRVAPLILLAQPGYQILLERENEEKYSVNKYHGNHGYEPGNVEMRGTFIAKGKSFKYAHKSNKPVYLIDYYFLFCHLLGLKANPNNGTFSRISHVLAKKEPEFNENDDLMQILLTFGIIFIVFLVFIAFLMPSFLIFSSVKMTCNVPNDVSLRKKVQTVKND